MTNRQPNATTEQIWRELSNRLRQFIGRRVSSGADADDILQTVFLRIQQKLADLRQTERLESWVFQIARNAVADHFRGKRYAQADLPAIAEENDEPDAISAELIGCLTAFIDRLPDEQKRAVAMYELDGVPQQEIATRESITLSGAKSRIQRGRKNLAAMLRACCEFQLDRRGNVLEYETRSDKKCGGETCQRADGVS